jgi:hypothetical protein
MSTLTGGDLNLVKPALTDDHKVTIGTDLPANFQKIDDEFTAHLAEGVHQTVSATNTDDATSNTNAPLKSAGGLAIAKKSYFGAEMKNIGGRGGIKCQTFSNVAPGASVVFTLPDSRSGIGGAVAGVLFVISSIGAIHSMKSFSLFARSTNYVTIQETASHIGADPSPFTVTYPSNGVVSVTNDSARSCDIDVFFSGTGGT